MARYCTCPICTQSVARPAQFVQGPLEAIRGAQVVMQPGWELAHWSGANFADMTSIEIHNFQQLGHKIRVGASFYLFEGPAPAPRPRQLALQGLGGGTRYVIDDVLGNQMTIYYKKPNAGHPAEVTVLLGCGGTISFDGNRRATAFNTTLNLPTISIL